MTKYLLAGLSVSLVAGMIVLGVHAPRSPEPLPANAPPEQFSAARALVTLRALAEAPRPLASPAAEEARATIVATLADLGLNTRVQTTAVVSEQNPSVAGTVRNVVARLRGSESSRAIVLVAHYDSVATSPGAADNSSGVAVLLETARALSTGPRLRHDVIFVFTDGEERGMLGAQAFLHDDPWRAAAAVVLNVDSPGSSTQAVMYDVGPGNEGLVRALSRGAPSASTSSLLYEVSRRLPIQTDLRPFLAAGVPGMTFASLDGPAYYHTAYDDAAHYDPRALQHLGQTVLGLTRHLGGGDLGSVARLDQPDVVFFDVAGRVVVYSKGAILPLLLCAGLLVALAVTVAARRRLLRLKGLALSLLAVPAAVGAALLVMALVWSMYRTAYAERTWSDVGMVISDFYRVGLVLLALATAIGVFSLVLTRVPVWDLATAALAWWLAAAVGVSVLVPGASYLFTWSLGAAALGLVGAALVGERGGGWPAAFLALLGAVPAIVLATNAVYLLLASEGLKQAITVAAVSLVAGLLVIPLDAVHRVFRHWLPVALAVAGGVVLFAVGAAVVGQAEHPRFTSVHYRIDATGAATWQTVDQVDVWTRQFVGEHPRTVYEAVYFPQMGMRPITAGPAPSLPLPPPRMRVLGDVTRGERRTVRLRLVSSRAAPVVSLLLHTAVGRVTATVDGLPLAAGDTTILDSTSARWRFDYYGPPPDGIVVTLRCAAGPSVLLRAVDSSYGIPGGLAARYDERPADMLPGGIGDTTHTETVLRLPGTDAPEEQPSSP